MQAAMAPAIAPMVSESPPRGIYFTYNQLPRQLDHLQTFIPNT
jgi:hypothetical protein